MEGRVGDGAGGVGARGGVIDLFLGSGAKGLKDVRIQEEKGRGQ